MQLSATYRSENSLVWGANLTRLLKEILLCHICMSVWLEMYLKRNLFDALKERLTGAQHPYSKVITFTLVLNKTQHFWEKTIKLNGTTTRFYFWYMKRHFYCNRLQACACEIERICITNELCQLIRYCAYIEMYVSCSCRRCFHQRCVTHTHAPFTSGDTRVRRLSCRLQCVWSRNLVKSACASDTIVNGCIIG